MGAVLVKYLSLVILFLSLFTLRSFSAQNSKEITFAVIPFETTLVMAKTFFPLIKYLEKRCDVKIRLVTAPTWGLFRDRVDAGGYDVVYFNPYHYIRSHETQGYLPIVKVGGSPFTGILLVRKDSNIKNYKELKGRTIVFPHRDAWAAFWLTKYYLLKKGIDVERDNDIVFVESHKSGILTCYHRLADAAGTWRPLRLINKDIENALTILFETEPHPNMPVAVHPRVGQELSFKLKNALLELHTNKEGQEILKGLNHVKFVDAKDSDYDLTRKICKELKCME